LIKVVIFDLDGTLIQLPINYPKMYAELKSIMKTDKVRPLLETVAKLDQKTKFQVFEVWEKAELEVVEKIIPNQEGMSLYQQNLDKPKALVTMQSKAVVNAVVERFKLHFSLILTREDSLSRAKQLLMATKKLKASFENVMFVGNADSDADAAKEMGCQFLRVK